MAHWVPRRIGKLGMLVLSLYQMHGLFQLIVGVGRLLAVPVSATVAMSCPNTMDDRGRFR